VIWPYKLPAHHIGRMAWESPGLLRTLHKHEDSVPPVLAALVVFATVDWLYLWRSCVTAR
jgi:hypothetical protein